MDAAGHAGLKSPRRKREGLMVTIGCAVCLERRHVESDSRARDAAEGNRETCCHVCEDLGTGIGIFGLMLLLADLKDACPREARSRFVELTRQHLGGLPTGWAETMRDSS